MRGASSTFNNNNKIKDEKSSTENLLRNQGNAIDHPTGDDIYQIESL